MAKERLYLFDTTLRDGAQTNGVDFTLADKVAIARMLDDIGIDYVEGGYPGANPTDDRFFAEAPKLKRGRLRLDDLGRIREFLGRVHHFVLGTPLRCQKRPGQQHDRAT